MKKYDFSMKKYDFSLARPSPLPPPAVEGEKIERTRPPFLQDFCKKAQWRAKKLRERGSNTARPTEKGGGGLPIGSRLGDSVASGRADSVDFVAKRRLHFGVSSRLGDSVASGRADTLPTPCRHPADTLPTPEATTKTRHKKARLPTSGNRAVSIVRCRASLAVY